LQTRGRLSIGPVLAEKLGRHEIVATLGRGGMADVFLAVRRGPYASNKLVVIKRLKGDASGDQQWVDMFVDEARIAMRLSHPNVVSTFDFVAEDDDFYLTMEFLDGQSLLQTLRSVGREKVPLDLHIWILTQVLAGLTYAHELRDFDGTPLGIVHRDVTPSNVILTYGGGVKLVDFGIAKVAGAVSVTQNGTMKGKIGYASPEQCLGKVTTARSDLYSVGIMLWEAIAEKRRTVGETPAAVYQARIAGTERPLEEARPDVPPLLSKIVRRALAAAPEDRHESAYEFQRELEQYLATRPPTYGTRALAEFMSAHFARVREAMHRTIESGIAGGARETGSRRLITSETSATISTTGIRPAPAAEASETSIPAAPAVTSAPAPVGRAPLRRGAALGIAAVAVSVVGAAAYLAARGSGPRLETAVVAVGTVPASDRRPEAAGLSRPSEAPAPAPARPEAPAPEGSALRARPTEVLAAASPSGAAPAAPQPPVAAPARPAAPAGGVRDFVAVRVLIRPHTAKARVVLDGQPLLGNNPFAGRAPKDGGSHSLVVTAPGYAPVERAIAVDREVRLAIKLDRMGSDELSRRSGGSEGGAARAGGLGSAGDQTMAPSGAGSPPPPKLDPPAGDEPGMDLRRASRPAKAARHIDEKDPYSP